MCSLNVNIISHHVYILFILATFRLVNTKSFHWSTQGTDKRFEGLTEYEIVTPVRLDEHTGLPLPSDSTIRHFQKRSANLNSDELEGEADLQATFLLGAFHQQFQLNLSRDSSFLSPSFVLEFLGGENGEDADELDLSAPLHCFYQGLVNGEPAASAVVSLCDGMYGLFQTPEGTQYFVEPLDDSNPSEGSTRPHIVYPITALQDLNKNSRCGMTDEDLESGGPPLLNTTNDVPGPHNAWEHKYHHSNKKRGHSTSSSRESNNLATQLFNMHERISKSIETEDSNNSADSSSDQGTEGAHYRGKRFISYPRHLELMVVADYKMYQHHGDNLEHYLLMLVALVNKIFKDPSVGNDINIVLVKLLVLRREEENLAISSDAPETLRNFCIWQRDQNPKEDSHPHHYDTAVLITKVDICRSKSDCDTLGLAELGTMCNPYRSCSIVQDNGLSAGFTMAHELGHVFNLPHDDNKKCREFRQGFSGKFGVMSPTLNFQINPWTWSRCSKAQITKYLDMGYGQCLLDAPGDAQILPSFQPGEVYNISRQCQLVFGEASTVCGSLVHPICSRLWCTGSSQGPHVGCRTQHMPWADGTPCGGGRWCDRGKCITRNDSIPPVDGGWDRWEPYGACSRTCGGGVKQAVRQCTQPVPAHGGKFCIGRRVRFRSCNTMSCPNDSNYRNHQCSTYNGNNFNIHGVDRDVRWVAKYTGVPHKDRCSLFCRVEGSIAFYKLAKMVVDGTPCDVDSDDMCVQGQCWSAGCDHVLGSQTTKDNCGVCNGDDRSCRTISDTYNKVNYYGYNEVVEIPAGSTNIDVQQRSLGVLPRDDNYLAITDSTGLYLLNGGFVVTPFQRNIEVGNAVLNYSGPNGSTEMITCREKITSNITIFVLSVGDILPPNIHYSFNVPITGTRLFVWDKYGGWGPCNTLCKGVKTRRFRCLRQSDRVQVKESHCDGVRPPSVTAKCNTGCSLSWQVMAESGCSATCGVGRRTRRIQCMKTTSSQRLPVVDSYCNSRPRPSEVVECQTDCVVAHWEYSAWSQCSQSCSGGTRRRSASCRDSNGYYTRFSNCNTATKRTVESCNTHSCGIWLAESWSECSVTCGTGEMQRSIECYHGNELLDSSQCDPSTKPETSRSCEMQECAEWNHGEWGPCSSTCGQGTSQRLVNCLQGSQKVEVQYCDVNLIPDSTTACEQPDCPFWQLGEWAPCSVSCGEGQTQRLASCYLGKYVVDSGRCDPNQKPATVDECNLEQCATWLASSWGPCSVSCGQGKIQRQVSCYRDNIEVDASHCDASRRPQTVSQCEVDECPQWNVGEFAECSATCGPGTQQRRVSCNRGNRVVPHAQCDIASVPVGVRPCQIAGCAVWKHGDWASCPVSCGEGTKDRYVGCYHDNQETSASQCDQTARPDSVTRCDLPECPNWQQGEWGPCSTTCGPGVKQRIIGCYQGDHQVDSTVCDLVLIPQVQTTCQETECAYWQHGEWGTCSVTCGVGEKRRTVNCHQGNEVMATSQCDLSFRPNTVMSCDILACPDWRMEEWGECSVTCGQGERKRQVSCYYDNVEIDRAQCEPDLMPETTRQCEMIECADWYQGTWEPCSVTCGHGEMQRRVSCSLGNRNVDIVLCDLDAMPETVRACEMVDCPVWRAGIWSLCSVTCGQGEMQRHVSCNQGNVESDQCDPTTMPAASQPCNLMVCPIWRHGDWGQCSVSCGLGYRLRGIQCRYPDDTPLPDSLCNQEDQPPNRQDCRMPECPTEPNPTTPTPPLARLPTDPIPPRTKLVKSPSTAVSGSVVSVFSSVAPSSKQSLTRAPTRLPTRPPTRPPTEPPAEPPVRPPVQPPVQPPVGLPAQPPVQPPVQPPLRPLVQPPIQSPVQPPIQSPVQPPVRPPVRPSTTIARPTTSHQYLQPRTSPETTVGILRAEPRRRYSSQWRMGGWTECSTTCGYGTRERYVSCRDKYGHISDRSECDSDRRPPALEQCLIKPCPHWRTGQWNRCSVTCGQGTTSRYVACVNKDNSIGDDDECDIEEKPKDIDPCNHQLCPSDLPVTSGQSASRYAPVPSWRWRTGPWSKCSSTCGGGLHQRIVICEDDTSHADACTLTTRPQNIETCNTAIPCPLWSVGEWGSCSATCGGGKRFRLVLCRQRSGHTLPDSACNILSRPLDTRQCSTNPCPSRVSWTTSPWNWCSVTCGSGVQERTVTCQDESGVERQDVACLMMDGAVEQEEKPVSQRECKEMECPRTSQWQVDKWSQCSVTCGVGIQLRTVSCEDDSGAKQLDADCILDGADGEAKPPAQRECFDIECPVAKVLSWQVDDWSECSVTCGVGVRSRVVICGDDSQDERQDVDCLGRDERPVSQEECTRRECHPTVTPPKWKVNDWSECSVTCGQGLRVRQATCYIRGQVVNGTLCPHKEPKTIKKCSRDKCVRHRWKKDRWTECSHSCGSGNKLRRVYCSGNKGQEVDEAMCQASNKPRINNKCNTQSCELPEVAWVARAWGECSTTCGPGLHTRNVSCLAQTSEGRATQTDDKRCNRHRKLQVTRPCYNGLCSSDVHWLMGPWSGCSRECGSGFQERKVQCRDILGKRHPGSKCGPPTIRPDTRKTCNYQPCQPRSCRDIQLQHHQYEDKDYSILVQGRPLSVYCFGMRSDQPVEFISLSAGEVENFAEIYPKRLLRATECPYNGNRNDNCECTDEGHRDAGLTTFTKLRLNITNMEIIITDPTFADVRYGKFVPYATAGDCYSLDSCPQGQFHINLVGTQLALARQVDWDTEGYAVTRRLAKDDLNQRVTARCGGYCGMCFPDQRRGGLLVTFLT